jgi:hypothetical protein
METPAGQPFIFEGYFSYNAGKSNEIRVAFLVEALEQNGSFEGIASDTDTEKLFEKGTIKIKGFVEEELISFVKTYPGDYILNEDNQAEAVDSVKPHQVEYLGNWIAEEEKYVGKYYVTGKEEWTDRHKGTYTHDGYEGYWEMKPSQATELITWPWLFFW